LIPPESAWRRRAAHPRPHAQSPSRHRRRGRYQRGSKETMLLPASRQRLVGQRLTLSPRRSRAFELLLLPLQHHPPSLAPLLLQQHPPSSLASAWRTCLTRWTRPCGSSPVLRHRVPPLQTLCSQTAKTSSHENTGAMRSKGGRDKWGSSTCVRVCESVCESVWRAYMYASTTDVAYQQ
jgi:hypothetical protein